MSLPAYQIRPARPSDVPAVVSMVHELAAYERAAEQCHLTEEQLRAALFGSAPALFGHVAAEAGTDDPYGSRRGGSRSTERGSSTDRLMGFALWFLNFSTWEGVHGIYLEDLFVRPRARGSGAGRALLAALAGLCVERGYRRLDWWVLRWNPARDFYAGIGAGAMDEWVPYRLEGDALHSLAAGGDTSGGRLDAT